MKINRKTDISKTHAMHILSERLAKRAFYACLLKIKGENNMEIKTKPSMALMIAIVMSGCGNDMPGSQRGDGMVAVGVSDVLSAGTDIAISRASSSIITDGAKMGVFRMAGSGYDAQDNVEFTYSSSTGKWANTSDPILVGIQATALCAYYPFNSATFNGTTASLKAQKYEPGKDLSYAINSETPVNNANPDATFAMKHAYARIKMSISRHSNYTGNCVVSTVNIKDGTDFFVDRTLDIKTDSYGGSATNGGWTYELNTGNIGAGETNSAYDVLVPPQPVNSGLTITLNIDGADRPVTVPALSFSSNLNAGSQYSISLVITDTEVNLNGKVDVADWDTDNTSITGGVVVVPVLGITVPAGDIDLGGETCTADDKEALSKLTWAPGNLRQANDDGSGATIFAGATDYGHYYTWNSTYTGTGNTDSDGTDPCTNLDESKCGSGWRTPSKNELDKLTRCTDKVLGSNDGVAGMWFMNNSKGLFLPSTGRRSFNEGCGTTGALYTKDYGYYWTSDAYFSVNAYRLIFKETSAVVSASERTYGFSVRCVKGDKQ